MRSKVWLALSLFSLVGVTGAQAYPECSCSCASSCTSTCVGSGGLTNCGTLGVCSTSSGCGGGGCLSSEGVTTLLGNLLQQPTVVPVGGQQGRAAARLTWRLTQYVEEGKLGDVYSANTGFFVTDGQGGVRAPELAFVSRDRASRNDLAGRVQFTSPDLVAEFLSSSNPAAAARQHAQIWLKAGTQAVLIVDSNQKSVSVYRNGTSPKVAGTGSVIDLSDIVPGWTLRIDDLFE